MIPHIVFWFWYAAGAILLIFFGVPDALKFSNGLFLVFYGLYALYLASQAVFRTASPRTFRSKRLHLWVAGIGIGLGGMAIEWLGVHSGWPFGTYGYTDILGVPVYGVPITMGFAWIAVVCNGALIGRYSPGIRGRLLRALSTGGWTVMIDLCLDPVAYNRRFWFWESSGGFYGVPWNNYISWFLIAALLSMLVPDLALDRRTARQGAFLLQMILLLFGILALQAGLQGSFAAALAGIILAEVRLRHADRRQIQAI
ncbi:carotenoid biosynthesis protein [Paenibacillus chibensis]|uniref:Carotenoid biosynthesis protein n=1 Tax=Paenibacillus chibensis TaxID=59846 RepID=A0ABU6Q0X2_9BACL|nr:carotenoid biosynthesis protein [Paenibacillus chibensis]